METGINLEHFYNRPAGEPKRDFEMVAQTIHDSGFRNLDHSGNYTHIDYIEDTKRQREYLDLLGMRAHQSHAPFNRYRTYPDAEFPELYHRSFECASILGAKYVVVHADEYRSIERYDENEIVEYTYDYLAPEVEFAKKHGMKVAVENLFEDLPSGYKYFDGKSRFTSRVEDIIAVIERFNDPDVVCCWDFGHGAVSYGYDREASALEKVAKYVGCTHVHDNNAGHDLHMLPFTGRIDWKRDMDVLARAGYDGVLSIELVYDRFPDELLPDWFDMNRAAADRLVTMCSLRKRELK